ncbi:MAG: NUDIX hydrolase, partial [Nitrosopumilaceae archaeon]
MELQQIKNVFSTSLSPAANQDGKSKLAAVMIVIYSSEPKIIMTERPKSMNQHAGEISFPGGKWKDDDTDLLETARRETKEEIDLEISRDQIIGQLVPVTTLNSGFKIT